MTVEKRALYSSPNGDRWFLARDPASGNVFIRHEANVPSGGRVREIEIGAFFSGGLRNPEHRALLDLIGTLVDGRPGSAGSRAASTAAEGENPMLDELVWS